MGKRGERRIGKHFLEFKSVRYRLGGVWCCLSWLLGSGEQTMCKMLLYLAPLHALGTSQHHC